MDAYTSWTAGDEGVVPPRANGAWISAFRAGDNLDMELEDDGPGYLVF